MAKGAKDDTPGVGTWARLSERPSVVFCILQGFTNVSMRMISHGRLCSLLMSMVEPLYHADMIQRVSAVQQRAEDTEGAALYADQGWLYHLKRQTDDSCGCQSL